MRISRRTSGGRGEYEISENSRSGLSPKDLFDRHLFLEVASGWTIDTGTVLTSQGGKRRIRMHAGATMQIHRQLTAALLMPHPVRADEGLGRGAPVLRTNRYALEHIEMADTELKEDAAILRVQHVIAKNRTYSAEEILVSDRVQQVHYLWREAGRLPPSISSLVREHQAIVSTDGPLPLQAETVVHALQDEVTTASADLGILRRSSSEDALPHLLVTLEWAKEPPEPPMAVDDIDPDETEIRRRTVRDWKRWASSRGAASARFRHEVREAYRATCLVCGLCFPPTEVTSAGVDAAHILPWAEYDLDTIQNGICLCKQHHWAFDQGLIVLSWDGTKYSIEVPDHPASQIAETSPEYSLAELRQYAGAVDERRLPEEVALRPHPLFLDRLRQNS